MLLTDDVTHRWIKQAALETPELQHLRRVKKTSSSALVLLSALELPPAVPSDFTLTEPFFVDVPAYAAMTPISLELKSRIWPTIYAPRRRGEPDSWTRAQAAWAWDAVEVLRSAAQEALAAGEVLSGFSSVAMPLRLAISCPSLLTSLLHSATLQRSLI